MVRLSENPQALDVERDSDVVLDRVLPTEKALDPQAEREPGSDVGRMEDADRETDSVVDRLAEREPGSGMHPLERGLDSPAEPGSDVELAEREPGPDADRLERALDPPADLYEREVRTRLDIRSFL